SATFELTSYCKTNPEMFESAARQSFSWPMLHSLHPFWVKGNEAILTTLNLGADTDINISAKCRRRFSFEPPANRIAIELYLVARSLRSAPMDDWEVKDWVALAWTSHLSKDDQNYLRPLETWGRG